LPRNRTEAQRSAMSSKTLRILLLDDDPADADLITETLTGNGFHAVTTRVDSHDEFARVLGEFAPDVVLSQHRAPHLDVRAALELLIAVRPTVPLIVFTCSLDEQTAASFVRAGAEDFVVKKNLGRLGPAIESALSVRRRLERLTPRQIEVLRLMVEGLTTPQIARRLQLSGKTVETHRGEIMKRVGIHDIVGLVRYAARVGLVPLES